MYFLSKKYFVVLFVLVLVSFAYATLCLKLFYREDSIFPLERSKLGYHLDQSTDQHMGGDSQILDLQLDESLFFKYRVSSKLEYPYIRVFLAFDNMTDPKRFVDLSNYYKITFSARCSKRNYITFNTRTFDEKITQRTDPTTYRIAAHWFECSNSVRDISVDMAHLEVPLWWLENFNLGGGDRAYNLTKVVALSFVASRHGPIDEASEIEIGNLVLHSYDTKYLAFLIPMLSGVWLLFFVWTFRLYTEKMREDIEKKLLSDRPLVAYRQLSLESHKDKTKSIVLQYLAKEYTNPDLNLELITCSLGINRKKVNDILKEELGLTFTSYLNKLRLSEAARLVCSQPDVSINEIALSIGYRNVTYFNKLFKDVYGCSPKVFASFQIKNRST